MPFLFIHITVALQIASKGCSSNKVKTFSAPYLRFLFFYNTFVVARCSHFQIPKIWTLEMFSRFRLFFSIPQCPIFSSLSWRSLIITGEKSNFLTISHNFDKNCSALTRYKLQIPNLECKQSQKAVSNYLRSFLHGGTKKCKHSINNLFKSLI